MSRGTGFCLGRPVAPGLSRDADTVRERELVAGLANDQTLGLRIAASWRRAMMRREEPSH